jgi:iron(III) transport system ATP-binding protein
MTLELKDIAVRLAGSSVLEQLSLTIPAGGTAVVMGASGAGKTTLLRTIAGLTAPSAGSIRFGDTTWNAPDDRVPGELGSFGMVFQDLILWPHLSVAENVSVTLRVLSRRERHSRISEVLDALGIGELLRRYPGELSGGQQQRVAIARAFARRPKLALLDEPTGSLDAATSEQVIGWIKKEQAEGGRILLVVTHSIECAQLFSPENSSVSRFRLHQGHLHRAS